jgi:leucyl aminopeptidase
LGSQATPEYRGITAAAATLAADVLFIPVFGDGDTLAELDWLGHATNHEVGRARSSREFASKLYELFVTPAGPGCVAKRIALVGAGAVLDARPERLRRLGAVCGYAARRLRVAHAAVLVRGGIEAPGAAQHLVDGLVSTEFSGATYRAEDPAAAVLTQVTLTAPGADAAAIAEAVRRGRIISAAANFTRALANEPANVHPEVLDERRLEELGMRLLLGVGQGSTRPPRLIVLRHEPQGAPASPVVGLIGKGVTFDTGGVSIKPADGMERMKSDMSGAAAVAGAMQAIARLDVPVRVIGVIPAAENMVGGNAIRPGDVLRGASGKTVEVINTDAEGRLILGDALWYAQKLGCTHLVDVATLTGACSIALGRHVSGLFGQPESWVDAVRDAGERGGDRLWPLPIYEEAKDQLRSEIADMVNSAGRPGGAIPAAAFLREFAGGRPWAHLDIAGTAWAESKEPYQPKGATGVAVRTLIEIVSAAAARQ